MEEVEGRAGDAAMPRLVETWFPFVDVSRLVAADRRSRDPVYGVHKWFARRPPTLVRALLLASHLRSATPPPADGTTNLLGPDAEAIGEAAADVRAQFWHQYAAPGTWLSDAVTYDPFMGGGTSLVESARMGARVVGRDVDPVAVAVVGSELQGIADGFDDAVTDLFATLGKDFGDRFTGAHPDWTPLHWFWLMRPTCGGCGHAGLLYKDLVIATSSGRVGSVVRDDPMHVFCPDCLTVHRLGAGRKELRCCGLRHRIQVGTYRSGRYRCPTCAHASSYEQLGAASAHRVMVAVEETHASERRRIRTATDRDRDLAESPAAQPATNEAGHETGVDGDLEFQMFDVPLASERRDRRPVSAGFTSSRTLFTPRQWAVFTAAFTRVRAARHDPALERDLTLMLTGALSSNNVLCGYARDWGRLAPLFSVRGFSIPALSVELNMFHPKAGRGTLRSAKVRMTDRSRTSLRRARLAEHSTTHEGRDGPTAPEVTYATMDLPVVPASLDLVCRSADDTAGQNDPLASVCVTDPPYFDYIAYSELSEFFRTWLRVPGLGGVPLLPQSGRAVESFAEGLGAALKATVTRLLPGTPLVFTYHSSNKDAWTAIGDAFDLADLSVVALWPVLADPHMGHHAAEGNCEWDLVVVARRTEEVASAYPPRITADSTDAADANLAGGAGSHPSAGSWPSEWIEAIEAADLRVGTADRASFEHAFTMAQQRFVGPDNAPTDVDPTDPVPTDAATRTARKPHRAPGNHPSRI